MNKISIKNKVIIGFLIISSIIIILIGTYLLYLSNPKRIFGNSLTTITNKINDKMNYNIGLKDYMLKDEFQIVSNTNNLTEIVNTKKYEDYKNIYNFLNNINNISGNIKVLKNNTKKELLIDYNTNIKDNSLIKGKYLIKNNTEYYYLNNANKTYINNGRNDYFESLQSNTTEEKNLMYVNDTISKAIKNNLDNKYFSKEQINGFNKITLQLDNKKLNTIFNKVIKDLQNDPKANKILTGYNKDFSKIKSKNRKILDKNKKIYISIYTDNILYNPKKYEIILKNNKEEDKVIYYNNKIKVYKNNKTSFSTTMSFKKNKTKIKIFNRHNKKIGYMNINRKKLSNKISLYIKDQNKETNLMININKYDIKKDMTYKLKTTIVLNHSDNNKELYNLNITNLSKINKIEPIREDISKSELASSINKEEKDKEEQIKQRIINLIKGV